MMMRCLSVEAVILRPHIQLLHTLNILYWKIFHFGHGRLIQRVNVYSWNQFLESLEMWGYAIQTSLRHLYIPTANI